MKLKNTLDSFCHAVSGWFSGVVEDVLFRLWCVRHSKTMWGKDAGEVDSDPFIGGTIFLIIMAGAIWAAFYFHLGNDYYSKCGCR